MASSTKKENITELLSALRFQNPTQYYTLIKMHLSFATDHATDQCDGSFDNSGIITSNKWNLSPLMRKFMRGNNHNRQSTDRSLLTYDVIQQVFELIGFLNKDENIIQEGLFRKTGSVTRQAELKAALQAGEDLNLDCGIYSAHDCASVLKSFLADLPEPLLQEGQYHVHCRIAEMCGRNLTNEQHSAIQLRQLKALRLVFLLLPCSNYDVLKELLKLLHRVTLFQEVNKMSSLNLGTMFAPHIFCPRKMSPNELQFMSGSLSIAIAFLIENALQLFEVPPELAIDVKEYFRTIKTDQQLSKKSMEEAPTKTSFTFIDRELTAKANDKNVTDMALAELYAYVQSLPDSAKKRKLINQFNEVSGQGTPKYNQSTHKKTEFKVKSFGDSIKKHLFNRSVKRSKTKNQQIKALNIKRSNSDDILSTSSVYCSPELGSKKSPKTKAKSLENLFSPKSSHSRSDTPGPQSSKHFVMTPLQNQSLEVSTPSSSTLTSTPASKGDLVNSSFGQDVSKALGESPQTDTNITPIMKEACYDSLRSSPGSLECSNLNATPVRKFVLRREGFTDEEDYQHESADGSRSYQNNSEKPFSSNIKESSDKSSPITRAMRNFNGQQKVMMTPRSRCPIIINSSSSLSSVTAQEESVSISEKTESGAMNSDNILEECYERERELSEEIVTSSVIISKGDTEEFLYKNEKPSNQSNAVSPHEDGSAISETWSDSLLGFFKHLSTSSLLKLASRLSSSSSLPTQDGTSPYSNYPEISHDDTLSTIFKEYLFSRSILTDNPIDLSSNNLIGCSEYLHEEDQTDADLGNKKLDASVDDTEKDLHECYRSQSDHQLKDTINSIPALSQSLLFCLDGNNPLYYNPNSKRHSFSKEDSQYCSPQKRSKVTDEPPTSKGRIPLSEKRSSNSLFESDDVRQIVTQQFKPLHSCSPNGRSSSLLKNRNGTPLRQRDREAGKDVGEGTKSVLFETDL